MDKKKFVETRKVRADFEDLAHPNAGIIERDIAVNELAKRDPIAERYDILDPNFLRFMAFIGDYGARKYGEGNWKLSRMKGNKSPINHIHKHLVAYQNAEPYDHIEIGDERYIHLAAIAFNAMMEFYHEFRGNDYDDPEK